MNKFEINISGLRKSFQREVLKGIDLKFGNSDFIAIIGKSGSGKSTLMNIIGLIEDFDEGEYLFGNTEISPGHDYANFRSENIGFIFQGYHLIPSLNCLENIMVPTLYSKKTVEMEYIRELLIELGIEHLAEQDVNTLSGGEKQRVAIARSLVMDPTFIIADEPTGNLDPTNRDIIMNLLQKENQRGRGVLLITHDMEMTEIAKTTYSLEDGVLKKYEKAN